MINTRLICRYRHFFLILRTQFDKVDEESYCFYQNTCAEIAWRHNCNAVLNLPLSWRFKGIHTVVFQTTFSISNYRLSQRINNTCSKRSFCFDFTYSCVSYSLAYSETRTHLSFRSCVDPIYLPPLWT